MHLVDQYSTDVDICQHFLYLMIYRMPEAFIEYLTLCHVSICSMQEMLILYYTALKKIKKRHATVDTLYVHLKQSYGTANSY